MSHNLRAFMLEVSNRPIAVSFFYFLALFAVASFRDNSAQPGIWIQVSELLMLHISDDPKTFARAGLEVSGLGWLSQKSLWIFHLWPPGFVVLLAGIFALFGGDAPYLAVLLLLSLLVGTIMLMVVRNYLLNYVPAASATLLPLLPFAFPVTRFFLFQPLGLAFGEGFSVMFFITACFLVLLAVKKESKRDAMVAGFLFALAAYFRSQYEILVNALCVAVVLVIAWFIFSSLIFGSKVQKDRRIVVGSMLFAVLAAQLFMLPWRINNYFDVGKFGWVQTSELVARNGLASDEKLTELGGTFVIIGGGNLACKFEPSYCDKSDPALFYRAFIQNPEKWLAYKAGLLSEFWFPSLSHFPRPVDKEVSPEYFGNGVLLLLVPAIFGLVCLIRKLRDSLVFGWILSSFFGCFFVIFALVQFEVRYFFLVKIFIIFMAIASGAAAWSTRFRDVKDGRACNRMSVVKLKGEE